MDIFLKKSVVRQLRISATDAIEDESTETLREDVLELFTEDQIEEIENRIDSADFYEFVDEILDEWSCEDVEELFELFEAQLSDAGIDLKYTAQDLDDSDDSDEEEEEEFSENDEYVDDEF